MPKAPGKLVGKVGKIRIYRDRDWDQFVVVDSLQSEKGWYYTDDKADAMGSARDMDKRWAQKADKAIEKKGTEGALTRQAKARARPPHGRGQRVRHRFARPPLQSHH